MSRPADPRIATIEGGGGYNPQYTGTLVDGRHFYIRYRHGWASIALGWTEREVWDPDYHDKHGFELTAEDRSEWLSDVERDDVIRRLLDAVEVPSA